MTYTFDLSRSPNRLFSRTTALQVLFAFTIFLSSAGCSGKSAGTDIPGANGGLATLNLTVLGLAGHSGTLTSGDGSISCSGTCLGLSVPASDAFSLSASTNNAGSTFAAWTSGPCKGTDPACSFQLTGTVSIVATFGPQSYMFVTSSTLAPKNFGGLTGADDICSDLAADAELPGTYKAWLSTDSADPSHIAYSRVGTGGWIRTDGRPFAYDVNKLHDPGYLTVLYPPRLDENGTDLGNVRILVATGSGPDGSNSSGTHCSNYTADDYGSLSVGDASSGSSRWSSSIELPDACSTSLHIYCFRSDLDPGVINPPNQNGRRVFVTSTHFSIGGGLTEADEQCSDEASNAGFTGQFVAFLATSSQSAAGRLLTTGLSWKRMDGVFIVDQPADLLNGNLISPIDALADGKHYITGNVWTGASDPSIAGTLASTCGDWGEFAGGGPGLVGDITTSTAPDWFNYSTVPCANTATHLICIEP